MILPDHELTKLAYEGLVDPFDPELVNPASIDLRLGNRIRRPIKWWSATGPIPNGTTLTYWDEEYEFQEIALHSREFVLCHSLETVCIPEEYCAVLFSKSSTGRWGLEHLHAGYVDPGFQGELTFEFKNVAPWPITLRAGQPLMQMQVQVLTSPPSVAYDKVGRYQGQTGPTPAR